MYVKKFTSLCLLIKMHTQIGSFFLPHGVYACIIPSLPSSVGDRHGIQSIQTYCKIMYGIEKCF